jgi:hypothetical protein
MMKMIPDGRGTLLNLTDRVPFKMKFTADLSNTKTEEFSDLAVVVFVQNNDTKEIIQSAYSSVLNTNTIRNIQTDNFSAKIYPSPFSQRLYIRIDHSSSSLIHVEILTPEGRKVHSFNKRVYAPQTELIWDGTNSSGRKVPGGMYLLRIISERSEITRKVIFQP